MPDSSVYRVKPSRLTSTQAVPPGSKSITIRALLLAALAQGSSTLENVLDAEDSRIMLEVLRQLGVDVQFDPAQRRAQVQGVQGVFPNQNARLYVGNSGATTRFITAALAFAPSGVYKVDGKPRMRERPIGDLLRTLQFIGRDVVSDAQNDCPPLTITGKRADHTPIVAPIDANVSSQFLSGLLMAAPLAQRDLVVQVNGALPSKPYVAMTLEVMRAFGQNPRADAAFERFDNFQAGSYLGRDYAIEPDASAASYFFALPAILGGEMTIKGLSRNSLQGDVAFVDCLEQMGCQAHWGSDSITLSRARGVDGTLCPLHGVEVDMNKCSDVAQTLAVVALFADSPTSIRNVANMRVKETDRITALVRELRKLGASVEERHDGLTIIPTSTLHGASIATYDDHRMAMSFALAGLRLHDVVIEKPDCVAKTYPNYFEDLENATTPIV